MDDELCEKKSDVIKEEFQEEIHWDCYLYRGLGFVKIKKPIDLKKKMD